MIYLPHDPRRRQYGLANKARARAEYNNRTTNVIHAERKKQLREKLLTISARFDAGGDDG